MPEPTPNPANAAPIVIHMTSESLMALAKALLGCKSMADRDNRDAVIGLLPDAIQHTAPRSDSALVDVTNLLDTALNYEDGLPSLIAAVRSFEGDSLPMRDVDRIIAEVQRAVLSGAPARPVIWARPRRIAWPWLAAGGIGLVAIVVAIIAATTAAARQPSALAATPAGMAQVTSTVAALSEPPATAPATLIVAPSPTVSASPTVNASPTVSPTPAATGTPEPASGATAAGPNEMTLAYVPAGTFIMGTSEFINGGEDERPQHEVYVEGFWMSLTEVTNAQYTRCVAAGACLAPASDDYNLPEFANRPVGYVGWVDANAYAQWVGGRLPTEAEWEKACRGTKGAVYPWGRDSRETDLLNYGYKANQTTDVGSYPKGASPYGLLDMAGNVWEWTASRYQSYPYDASSGVNDLDPPGVRTLRGGGWFDTKEECRCASRTPADASSTYSYIGFRVVAAPLP